MTLVTPVERALFAVGSLLAFALAVVLLITFGIGFADVGLVLTIPFWLLAATSLTLAAAHIVASFTQDTDVTNHPGSVTRVLLVGAIPAGFVASSLDCTGLSFHGCSQFCTFVKVIWLPIIALMAILLVRHLRPWLLVSIAAMSAVPLAPHCVCYNTANSWWIDRIGASPECYAWGFVGSLISIGAMRTGRWLAASALVAWAIVAGSTAFFVGHHYFGFPW